MRVGYARVSTRDQHPDAQHDALLAAGCEPGHIYIDKVSGKLARRPELDKALLVLRNGDQFAVTRLDRLGRSLAHLITLSAGLRQRGVDLVVLTRASTRPPPWAGCSSRSWRDRGVRARADVRAHYAARLAGRAGLPARCCFRTMVSGCRG